MIPESPLLNEDEIPSPSLLLYPDRVAENLRRMITRVGDPARLRPHLKTHKLPQLVALQASLGVSKVKCATLAEAEMAAGAGATDILVAFPLVGPNVVYLISLQRRFPQIAFSSLADDPMAVAQLGQAATAARTTLEVLLDLDVGMHRTGIAPGAAAVALYRRIVGTPGLRGGGLHAYDGHLHQRDPSERSAAADLAFAPVAALAAELREGGHPVPRVVCGGAPTFPSHSRREGVECSPGTCLLWDAGYAENLPDLDFLTAAVLLTRVISRPTTHRLCLDLGHKAVASEMPHPRAIFPSLPEAQTVSHSEEHLVLETPRAGEFSVGTVLYAVPWHICPTVALHEQVQVVREDRVVEAWPVVARARQLSLNPALT
ncbi:MAG: D-TA family PLP-dependent enzyme [Opitutaceae bacterium]